MQGARTAPLTWTVPVLGWIAAGFVLRLARPQVHSFWIDEGSSVMLAQSRDFLAAMRADSHPPLSFLILRGWGALFGWSDLALRMLPALVSCASLVLFAPLARAWVGARRAPWVVALYALAPLLIWLAHEVRMYAFVELAVLLTLHAARSAWSKGGIVRWLALGACVALATGLHYYGSVAGLVVIAQALVRRRHGAISWRTVVTTVAVCGLGVLAWLPWLVTILPAQLHNGWPRIARFTLRDLAETPVRLVAVDLSVLDEHHLAWIGWVLAALCTAGFLVWLACTVRGEVRIRADPRAPMADPGMPDRADRIGADDAVCAALVPIAVVLLLALTSGGGFQPRYVVAAGPGMIACVAGGLASLRPAWALRAAGVTLLGCALATDVLQLAQNRREDYRSACREIVERWRPGDRLLVVCCVPPPYVLATVDHYLRERPDILASALDTRKYLAGEQHVASGTRIHVIWREATICWQPFDALRRTHRFLEEAPARFRIHRVLAVAP